MQILNIHSQTYLKLGFKDIYNFYRKEKCPRNKQGCSFFQFLSIYSDQVRFTYIFSEYR